MPVLASRMEIDKLIKRHLGVGSETVEGLMEAAEEDDGIELMNDIESDGSELSELAQESSVIRLVNENLPMVQSGKRPSRDSSTFKWRARRRPVATK